MTKQTASSDGVYVPPDELVSVPRNRLLVMLQRALHDPETCYESAAFLLEIEPSYVDEVLTLTVNPQLSAAALLALAKYSPQELDALAVRVWRGAQTGPVKDAMRTLCTQIVSAGPGACTSLIPLLVAKVVNYLPPPTYVASGGFAQKLPSGTAPSQAGYSDAEVMLLATIGRSNQAAVTATVDALAGIPPHVANGGSIALLAALSLIGAAAYPVAVPAVLACTKYILADTRLEAIYCLARIAMNTNDATITKALSAIAAESESENTRLLCYQTLNAIGGVE